MLGGDAARELKMPGIPPEVALAMMVIAVGFFLGSELWRELKRGLGWLGRTALLVVTFGAYDHGLVWSGQNYDQISGRFSARCTVVAYTGTPGTANTVTATSAVIQPTQLYIKTKCGESVASLGDRLVRDQTCGCRVERKDRR